MAKKYFKLQGGSIWGPKACKTNAIPLDHRDFTNYEATIKLKLVSQNPFPNTLLAQQNSKFCNFSKFSRSNCFFPAYMKSMYQIETPHIVRNGPKLSSI